MSYYFIGIGGIGMSGLARILLQKGQTVAGSDATKSETKKSYIDQTFFLSS